MDAVQYLQESLAAFEKLYATLSPEEAVQPGPEGTWSAADFAEHLATAERGIGVLLKRGLAGEPASAEEMAATQGKTEVILSRVPAAPVRVEAPEQTRPSGRYGAWPGALEALVEARKNTIALAHQVEPGRWESVVMPHPALGPMSGEQWLLFCAAHMERHQRQMAARFGRS